MEIIVSYHTDFGFKQSNNYLQQDRGNRGDCGKLVGVILWHLQV